jgi:hypothetical protein
MNTYIDKDRRDIAKLFKGKGVEVGVAAGHFSAIILENPDVELCGVDSWLGYGDYRDYTKKSTFDRMRKETKQRTKGKNFYYIKQLSMDALKNFKDEELDFVYIDANHDYKHVLEDITGWTKKVKPGGIVAGDDYFTAPGREGRYDVIQAVDDYVRDHNIPELFIYNHRNPPNWMFIRP